jgi:hypothetical protein
MMVFKLPKNICKGITDVISQFWWGDDDNHKKIHWKAWWKLCIPKKRGGMGFRDLESFNGAMLAKQVWRLLLEPESICARVMRGRYYPDGNLLQQNKRVEAHTLDKVCWLVYNVSEFRRGYICRVGDGSQINIWEDNWIPSSHNLKVLTPCGNNLVTKVDELINAATGTWDENLIKDLFWPVDAYRILQIPLTHGREDLVAWHYNRNGLCLVRWAYHGQWIHKFEENTVNEQAGVVGEVEV